MALSWFRSTLAPEPEPEGPVFSLDDSILDTPSLQTEPFAYMRELDRVWHNPTSEQLAETLKVVIMASGGFAPLPVHYNSCILHVLEEYHFKNKELETKTKALEELKKEKDEIAKELKEKTLELGKEQTNYKEILEKLEVMLASGEGGGDLELLSMVRSSIVVLEEKIALEVQKEDNEPVDNEPDVTLPKSPKKGIMLPYDSAKKDVEMSRQFMRTRRGNSLSMGFGSVTPPIVGHPISKALLDEVKAEPAPVIKTIAPVIENTAPMIEKTAGNFYTGRANALRIFNFNSSPRLPKRSKKDKNEKTSSSLPDHKGADNALAKKNRPSKNAKKGFKSKLDQVSGSQDSILTVVPYNADRSIKNKTPKKESASRPKRKASGLELAIAAAKAVTRGKVWLLGDKTEKATRAKDDQK